MGSRHDPHHLPDDLEAAVLEILDGDEHARTPALASLLRANAGHADAIRSWLQQAGVTVPEADATNRSGTAGGEFPRPLGDYQLLAVIGRGGFGTVYRAEQQRPIRRAVAIKVLNPGMDSREILARFTGEREALNRMDHPGIARLLDAGSTPEGRPFFVMELVEGPSLNHYCRQHELPLRARLILFLDVLDAVQHAHQKAVVHRDLSANNVLVASVDDRPRPKIIDFGIAKSLGDPLLLGGAQTLRGTLLGTPEYMSPEQAAGRIAEVDTRTDVYSLGVQLYELLTGLLPIPGVVLRSQGIAGMAKVIADYRPPRASDLAPAPMAKALRGDLDAILGKALAKSVDERYSTVAEFANDLRNHLAHRPVHVAPPSPLTRLVKFGRRQRALATALLVAGVGLVTGTILLGLSLTHANRLNAEIASQQQQLGEKADAGFRLLANKKLLRDAIAAAEALPPPWPEHEGDYQRWEQQHRVPLEQALDETRRRLRAARPDNATDPQQQVLIEELSLLHDALQTFFTTGHAHRIRSQRARLDEFAHPTEPADDPWREVIRAVKSSDGVASARAYAGLGLSALPGLQPLGIDRASGLAEFLDLNTHPPGVPLPARDADGHLPTDGDVGIVFVLLPPGTVRLGATPDEPGLPQFDPDAEGPERGGELLPLDPFLMARTELTRGQWARLTGEPPPRHGTATLPQNRVEWSAATVLLQRHGMSLPTEAQWEYACRAGTTTPWSFGRAAADAATYAHRGDGTDHVGRRHPNAFGLFDMHGNVAEWCIEQLFSYGQGTLRRHDGLRTVDNADDDGQRIVRGGSFQDPWESLRSSARETVPVAGFADWLGLRPVRPLR